MKLIILILLLIGLDLDKNHYIDDNEVERYSYISFAKSYTINMGSDSQLWIKESKGVGYIKGIGTQPARLYLVNDDLNAYNGLKLRGNLIVIYGDCNE